MEDNYLVSARKYRPQKFDDVVGQEKIAQTLKNAIKSNHLAHAFLFNGTRGVGKTSMARILAKTINCKNRTDDAEACEACDSCQTFKSNTSFNVHELDAASKNSVDDIRNLIEQVSYPPQNAAYKVFIIDEVHMLSPSAFNSFLKTLEEPPSYAKFILATTEKHKIPMTILSRCQTYDFKKISVQDIQKHLAKISEKEGVDAEPSALNIVAIKAEGGLRDALSIFDRLVSINDKSLTYEAVLANLNVLDYEYFFKLTTAIHNEDNAETLLILDEILQNGFEIDTTVNGLSEHMRNLWVAKKDATLGLLETTEDIRKRYIEQSNQIEESSLLNYLTLITDTEEKLKYAPNKRLTSEVMFVKLCYISQLTNTSWTEVGEKKKSIADSSDDPSIKSKKVENFEEDDLIDTIPKASANDPSLLKASIVEQSLKEFQTNREIYNNILPTTIENHHVWELILQEYEKKGTSAKVAFLHKYTPTIQDDTFLFVVHGKLDAEILGKTIHDLEAIYFKLTSKKANWKCEVEIKEDEDEMLPSNALFEKLAAEFPVLNKLRDDFQLDLT